MPTITPIIRQQLTALSSQLSAAISQASEQVSAIEGNFQKLGDVYKEDPQAIDHFDIFRNNASSLSSNAALLGMLTNSTQGDKAEKITQQLGLIAGWKHKKSHIPVDDGRTHAQAIPEQTRESATREMTCYIGNMIEKHTGSMDSADADTLKKDFENLTKTVGLIYRYIETAGRLESMISQEGMATGISAQ